jgi:hypothetical protein
VTAYETACGIFWGTVIVALFVVAINYACFHQKRKKWAKDIRPGKGMGL